ncbi:TPA: hypothetical protein QCZ17_004871 [Bacillus cereus]|uniref:hypothetical protein n=1 Tax=Bacillus wiedmannii TaxID=1890302 RepID=UPI001485712B|nr:hypothetical protein [Bacillus wiedmannii]MDA2480074.1 hypothetical protein [Bacillus cereus]MDA2497068.1 hypothetical protein [Bacillus cereus]HDR8042525.1 hypothetical protein [Bacillus cereus]
MKKILFAITTIALVAGIVFTATDSKEQSKDIVKKDSEQLYARMGDPGGGMG